MSGWWWKLHPYVLGHVSDMNGRDIKTCRSCCILFVIYETLRWPQTKSQIWSLWEMTYYLIHISYYLIWRILTCPSLVKIKYKLQHTSVIKSRFWLLRVLSVGSFEWPQTVTKLNVAITNQPLLKCRLRITTHLLSLHVVGQSNENAP